MAMKGKDLDEAGRARLAEDLLSPCTEEIAVFQQFSRVLSESRRRFAVDTAPTAHTRLRATEPTGDENLAALAHLTQQPA